LDTRTKIISLAEARAIAENRPSRWTSGFFDPLLAEHHRRLSALAEAGRLLIVQVTNPAEPLLEPHARAALVAALRCVDYVVVDESGVDTQLDDTLTEQFADHVVKRHRGERA
jgi:bifunctional ADP-heptose synthase (sugar kinase/adenylyltransferase)